MKNFFRNMLKYLLISFAVSVVVYSFSAAFFTGNFAKTIFPEVKHLIFYHLLPSPTSAMASTAQADKIGISSPFRESGSSDNEHCIFLIMWGLCFFYLLFFKYSGLADTGKIFPARFLYSRKIRPD